MPGPEHAPGASTRPRILVMALAVSAPLAGLLHWLESWLAHDMAYRLLNDMRLALFRKLDAAKVEAEELERMEAAAAAA